MLSYTFSAVHKYGYERSAQKNKDWVHRSSSVYKREKPKRDNCNKRVVFDIIIKYGRDIMEKDVEKTIKKIMRNNGIKINDHPNKGRKYMIWFVGAGCYHPDMLTIGAKKLLEQADCVLYDHLVNKEFLQYASKDCECICVGKRGHQRSCAQEDIFTLLVQKDKQYKNVVRLNALCIGKWMQLSICPRNQQRHWRFRLCWHSCNTKTYCYWFYRAYDALSRWQRSSGL